MSKGASFIAGADDTAGNKSGNNYVDSLQVCAAKSRLHSISFSPLAGMAVDVFAWIYDSAAGAPTDTAPKLVLYCPSGVGNPYPPADTGWIFNAGIYVVLSSAPPTDATTAPTLSGNNKVIIKADFRKL